MWRQNDDGIEKCFHFQEQVMKATLKFYNPQKQSSANSISCLS